MDVVKELLFAQCLTICSFYCLFILSSAVIFDRSYQLVNHCSVWTSNEALVFTVNIQISLLVGALATFYWLKKSFLT